MFQILLFLLITTKILTAFSFYDNYGESKEKSESEYGSKSSSHNKQKEYSYKSRVVHNGHSGFNRPFGYGFTYASDFGGYSSLPIDLELNSIDHVDLDLDYGDLDIDFDSLDTDLDLEFLKYQLYGLNHLSIRKPYINDYRFRRKLKSWRRPRYRTHHRYYPRLKYDLDFWGLDNYSLGFGYNKYSLGYNSPTSYVNFHRYS